MCLAVPGQIETITDGGELARTGRVRFGGTLREVNLSLVPDAAVGDYVLVHVGLALSRVDEAEARQTLEYLRQMEELVEDQPGSPPGEDPRPPGTGGSP